MQVLKVPLVKDLLFEKELKKYLLYRMDLLFKEYNNNIPDTISCKGHLGKHVFNIITNNNWKFGSTKIVHEKGPNAIEIRFDNGISIEKNSKLSMGTGSTIDGRVIEGFIDSKSQTSIIRSSIDNNFTIEKTVNPKVIIKLEKL